jgi:hypothetical protein
VGGNTSYVSFGCNKMYMSILPLMVYENEDWNELYKEGIIKYYNSKIRTRMYMSIIPLYVE